MLALLAFLAAPPVSAQNTFATGVGRDDTNAAGRTAADKASAPIPRFADGTPNLSWTDPARKGVWYATVQHWRWERFFVDKELKEIPFQPWAKALYEYRVRTEHRDDPQGYCLPSAGTRASSLGSGWEFVQLPDQKRILRVHEAVGHMWQPIYMDGRSHPESAYDFPTWFGHSIGHWEGDTLVIDTVGFNEGHWASRWGAIRTNYHHIIEKYTRTDYYTLHYEATIDDPGAYTQPFTFAWDFVWNEGEELAEFVCNENNRAPQSLSGIEINGLK